MFCSFCGTREVQESICDICVAEQDIDDAIKHYFHRGYPYDAIVVLLKKREGLQMCVRTLKRFPYKNDASVRCTFKFWELKMRFWYLLPPTSISKGL